MAMSNPDTKDVMEPYAIWVGKGFFWYQSMMAARSRAGMGDGMPMICPPDNIPFAGKIIMDGAKRVMETAEGDDIFELKLLRALMEMFPCK